MKKSIGKIGTISIILVTVLLAGIAIFTAYRLYELRQQSVAPNVPSSYPKAAEVTPTPVSACSLTFTLSSSSPTPTGSSSPTPTSTVTPTPTSSGSPNSCGGTCGSNSNCGDGYYCNTSVTSLNGVAVTGVCRNSSCPNNSDCNCPGTTASPAPTSTSTSATLPVSGTDWPSIMGLSVGVLVVVGSIILVL